MFQESISSDVPWSHYCEESIVDYAKGRRLICCWQTMEQLGKIDWKGSTLMYQSLRPSKHRTDGPFP